jgi:S23 ribosomal protein.
MNAQFDHEKLKVYQRALDFIVFLEPVLAGLPSTLPVCEQLDRASTSIALNIAEGNGKFTAKDRCRFFDIARGSALESAAALDVLVRKKRLPAQQSTEGKAILHDVVSMLVGLIRSQKGDRVFEEAAEYGGD